jgi:dTDP-4-dehydrorhamnose reductase
MNRNIYVLGSRGMAGSMIQAYLKQQGHQVIGLTREDFDALSDEWPMKFLAFESGSILINCIGIIPQKVGNNTENLLVYEQINSKFPHKLAEYCSAGNIQLIHLSTNCVFEEGPSVETKVPDALDIYGQTKGAGEPKGCHVIRTSIIGPESFGPKVSLLEWFLKQTTDVRGYSNHIWNGITTLELAKYIEDLLKHPQIPKKTVHLFSTNSISKYDLLLLIAQVYRKTISIVDYKTPVSANTTLQSILEPLIQKTIEQQINELWAFTLLQDYAHLEGM